MSKKKTSGFKKPERSPNDEFEQALKALREGRVAVFPTETFYGLAADALNPSALERLIEIKGRDPKNPIPIIIARKDELKDIAQNIPPTAKKLMDRFWPGPLTLVLPGKESLHPALLNPKGGVGVRISSHPVARRLASAFKGPLTATSANPSGKPPAATFEEARGYFSEVVEIFLDGGKLEGKKGSTVLEVKGNELRVYREGEISLNEIEQALSLT